MPSLQIYLNGKLIPSEEGMVSIEDRGFLYGHALFETMRAYGGRVFRLDAHLKRLCDSARFLRISPPATESEMRAGVAQVLEANGLAEARVRVTLSAGVSNAGLGLAGGGKSLLIIQAGPLPSRPTRLYQEGANLITATLRQNPYSPLPSHKSANYLFYLLARQEAADAGADDALILNTRGEIAEAATANVFIVRKGELRTPPISTGILPGITREVVMEICRTERIPCREEPFGLFEVRRAEEMFLTNSLLEILPVRSVDGKQVGGGTPGPITQRLREAYAQLVRNELGL